MSNSLSSMRCRFLGGCSVKRPFPSTKPVLFGDFNFYWIGDRQGVTFKRLNERYADTGQIGFLATKRVDAKLVLPEAVKCLQMKAAA